MDFDAEDKNALHDALMAHIDDIESPNMHYAYQHIIEMAHRFNTGSLLDKTLPPRIGLLDEKDINSFADIFTAYKEFMGGLDNGFMRVQKQKRINDLSRFVEWMSDVMKKVFFEHKNEIDAAAQDVFPTQEVDTQSNGADVSMNGKNPQVQQVGMSRGGKREQ